MGYQTARLTKFSADDALAGRWLLMRSKLWPDSSQAEHRRDAATMAAAENLVLMILDQDETAVGFAEVTCRAWANGCKSSPVAYLEGIYLEPQHRGTRAADLLLHDAEDWAAKRGMTELASDAVVDNDRSVAAHVKWGFDEVMRVVCFRKTLTAAS